MRMLGELRIAIDDLTRGARKEKGAVSGDCAKTESRTKYDYTVAVSCFEFNSGKVWN
jgi:hypothetical protein